MLNSLLTAVRQANLVYLILKGRVNCIAQKGSCFKTYIRQSYFGDIEVLQRVPRLFTTKAASDCDFITISSQIVEECLDRFPEICIQLFKKAIKRLLAVRYSMSRFQNFNGITMNDCFWNQGNNEHRNFHRVLELWLNIVKKKANDELLSPL